MVLKGNKGQKKTTLFSPFSSFIKFDQASQHDEFSWTVIHVNQDILAAFCEVLSSCGARFQLMDTCTISNVTSRNLSRQRCYVISFIATCEHYIFLLLQPVELHLLGALSCFSQIVEYNPHMNKE